MLSDFPKIECPLMRKEYSINKDDFKKYKKKYCLRDPKVYLASIYIKPGFEWVFEDQDTIAVEKLNGTNVKLKTENGRLINLQNRKNVIDPLNINSGYPFIVEGVFMAIKKGYVKKDGEQSGEVIGTKIQGNPYNLNYHLWYPFDRAVSNLFYRSFKEEISVFSGPSPTGHGFLVNLSNLSDWIRNDIYSLYKLKLQSFFGPYKMDKCGLKCRRPEGIIFYNLKRKSEGKVYMAKIRCDMFHWFYEDDIEILR